LRLTTPFPLWQVSAMQQTRHDSAPAPWRHHSVFFPSIGPGAFLRAALRRGSWALLLLCFLAAGLPVTAQPKVLYEKPSAFNTIIVTEDDSGLRALYFEKNGARQSVVKVGDPDHIELPYASAMLAGLALAEKPARILIIGLGGGTLPTFLHRHFPQAAIDVVDIDPDVVTVAKQFFGFREDAKLRAHVADGRRFVEETKEPYDLVFLDAFGADSIPYHLATRQFLEAVRRATRADGVVLGNVWSQVANSLYNDMLRTYQEVFPSVTVLEVRGTSNRIVIARRQEGPLKKDEFAQTGAALAKAKRWRFDLGEIIRDGFLDASRKDPTAHVLLDKPKD
jgi:spermidine synthase